MRSRFSHIIIHNEADNKFDCFAESARSILSDYKKYSSNMIIKNNVADCRSDSSADHGKRWIISYCNE